MIRRFSRNWWIVALFLSTTMSCSKKNDQKSQPHNPVTAESPSIDRFSATAGHLQIRTASNGLPAANAPINFDQGVFITKGFAPDGRTITYYNFDVQPEAPAPIYIFYKNGQTNPVPGQLNVIDVIPGDANYNDFWQVFKVTVPDDYVANTIASVQELSASGYKVEKTNSIVNCPVVPRGSTATKRFINESNGLINGWYKDKLVYYFNFGEKNLMTSSGGKVPLAPIYVTFNINPNQPNGGPDSGFKTEPGSDKTHNVVAVLPTDAGYSPFWIVVAYDNSNFNTVNNLMTASAATVLVPNAGFVNCPIVSLQ